MQIDYLWIKSANKGGGGGKKKGGEKKQKKKKVFKEIKKPVDSW